MIGLLNKVLYTIKRRISIYRDILYIGKSHLCIPASAHLLLKNSKIIIEEGTLNIGKVYGKYGGYGFDHSKDNCRIHLVNSTLHIYGDVTLYPGCRIIGNNAEIIIRNGTRINAPTYIIAEKKIEIGENCLVSFNVTIRDNDGHKHSSGDEVPSYRIKEVNIQNDCWIGQNVLILKGVTLGKGSVISAGSLITKDVPEKTLAGNNSVILRNNVKWEE